MLRVLWWAYLTLASLSLLIILYLIGAYYTSDRWSDGSHSLPAYGAVQEPAIAFKTDSPDRIRILVVNGGAMLGLSDLVILSEIEERSGKQIYELFDFFAGSSTGAIISTLLLLPQDASGRPMSAKDAIGIYEQFSTRVFANSLTHRLKTGFGMFGPVFENTTRIEIAKQLFKDKTFGELLRPAMFPSYSQNDRQVKLFRNWRADDSSLLVSSLLAAVTAAPVVFPFITLKGYPDQVPVFGDAGVILNAPGELAYLQAREGHPEIKRFVVVTVDTHTPLVISDQTATHGGLMQWLIPLVRMAVNGEADIAQDILNAHSQFHGSAIDLDVFGMVAKVRDGVSVYSTDEETISALLAAGRNFVSENSQLIDQAVQALNDDGR